MLNNKILIVCNNLSIVGGAETYLQALLPALVETGHEVAVLHGGSNNNSKEKIVDLVPGIQCWAFSKSKVDIIWRQIKSWDPGIIYCHGFDDLSFQFKLIDEWPTFFYAHGYYGTCISGQKRWSFPKYKNCKKILSLFCLGFYFTRGCGGRNPLTGIKAFKQARQQQELLKKYTGVFVASTWMFDEYLRHGVSMNNLHLLPYFPPGLIPDINVPGKRPFSNRVLFAGRIVENKGWKHALLSLKKASIILGREIELIVAGDGPDLGKMKAESVKIGVKSLFLGWVDRSTIIDRMREVDLLLMPSLWSEPFGLLGIEAGCLGLTTVGYRVGGISDWLILGDTGESGAIGETNSQNLAEAMVRCLGNDDYWQKLREGAWRKSHEFTKERHLNRLAFAFSSIKQ